MQQIKDQRDYRREHRIYMAAISDYTILRVAGPSKTTGNGALFNKGVKKWFDFVKR